MGNKGHRTKYWISAGLTMTKQRLIHHLPEQLTCSSEVSRRTGNNFLCSIHFPKLIKMQRITDLMFSDTGPGGISQIQRLVTLRKVHVNQTQTHLGISLPSRTRLVATFNLTQFWLYRNSWTDLAEQHYIGFFQLRAEGAPVEGSKAECY